MTLFSRLFGRAVSHQPRRTASRAPRLEALEGRTLPAGNVTSTSFVSGSLVLRGDGADNSLRITKDPATADRILVQATGGTQLNGVVNGSATFRLTTTPAFEARFELELFDGSDSVEFDVVGLPLFLPTNLRMGGGENTLTVTHLDLRHRLSYSGGDIRDLDNNQQHLFLADLSARSLEVFTGAGDDTVAMGNLQVRGNAVFETGAGSDLIQNNFAQGPKPQGIRVGGEFRINTGADYRDPGADNVTFVNAPLQVGSKTAIVTGGGNDQVFVAGAGAGAPASLADLTIETSAGDDLVRISSLNALDLNLEVGTDRNTVGIGDLGRAPTDPAYLGPVTVGGQAHLTAVRGNNFITISRVTFSSIFQFLNTGFTDDLTVPSGTVLVIQASAFNGEAHFNMGAGRDSIYIQRPDYLPEVGSTVFRGRVFFNLGAGNDWVFIGHFADLTHSVSFRQRVTFNGGPGRDLYYGFSPSSAVMYEGGRVQISGALLDALP